MRTLFDGRTYGIWKFAQMEITLPCKRPAPRFWFQKFPIITQSPSSDAIDHDACCLRPFHQHDDDVVCDGGWMPGVCSVCLLLWRLLDGWMMGFCCPEDDEYCTYFLLSFLSRLHKKVVRLFHWLANCNTHNKYHPRSSNRWLEWVGASVRLLLRSNGGGYMKIQEIVLWLWAGLGTTATTTTRTEIFVVRLLVNKGSPPKTRMEYNILLSLHPTLFRKRKCIMTTSDDDFPTAACKNMTTRQR